MAFSRLWFCPFVMNTVNLSDCRLKRGSTTFTRPLKMPMILVESKKASSEEICVVVGQLDCLPPTPGPSRCVAHELLAFFLSLIFSFGFHCFAAFADVGPPAGLAV